MHLEERRDGDTVVVDLHGPVVREHGDLQSLLSHVRGLANHGCTNIVLNVAELTNIDSVLIGAIAHAYISANRIGATLRLQHASAQLRRLLALTKLDRVIQVVED